MRQYNSIDTNQYYYIKRIIFILAIFTIFLFSLLLFKSSRCFLVYYSSYGYETIQACEELNESHQTLALIILVFEAFMFFLEILIFMTLLYNVLKYKLKSDRFKIRLEIIVIFCIWAFYHNIVHGYMLYFQPNDKFMIYLFYSFQNLSFNILYVYLTYTRKKIDKNTFLRVLQNYDMFMQNHLCFSFFKEYIKNNQEEASSYLSFWVDFYIYKFQVNIYRIYFGNNNQVNINTENKTNNNQQLIDKERERELFTINQLALHLYYDYFYNNVSISGSGSSINHYNQNSGLYIDFPVDIHENVQEYATRNFNGDFNILSEIYDESFLYVNNKLYNVYLSMCHDEKEYNKIEKMLSFIDVDEVKEAPEFMYSRKTTYD
jgi:hypothetical protein